MSKIMIKSKMVSSPDEFEQEVQAILAKAQAQRKPTVNIEHILIRNISDMRQEWENALGLPVDEIECPSLGSVLRDICVILGLSQDQVAEAMGDTCK